MDRRGKQLNLLYVTDGQKCI